MSTYVIEILGVALIITGCVASVVAKDEGRKVWRIAGLALTGVGALIVLNF